MFWLWYWISFMLKNVIPFITGIRYLIGVKKIITYVFSHNYAVINVDSQDYLPVEKTLTFHNVMILIKSVFRK